MIPNHPLRRVKNAFGVCEKRFQQLGAPGMALFTEAGVRAADQVGSEVTEIADTAACSDRAALQLLDSVLKDGRVEAREIRLLKTARRHVAASATADIKLVEVVT